MRRRLTFANVTSVVALALAAGGTGYAATALPANSVGTAQLRASAVTGAKVKDRSLSAADLRAGTALPGRAWVAAADGVDATADDSEVAGVTVPPGAYVVSGKLYAHVTGTGVGASLLCNLYKGSLTGTQLDVSDDMVGTGSRYSATSLLGVVKTTARQTRLILSCSTDAATPADVTWFNVKLVATQVASITGSTP